MARAGTAISDVLGIEDEVWQEAFTSRIPRRREHEDSVHRERFAPLAESASARGEAAPARLARAPRPVAAASMTSPSRPAPAPSAPERRTVTIKGRGAERHLPWPGDEPRRRPTRPVHQRAGFRPDRLAMWAMFLGLLLVLVAVLSSHG